MIQNFTFPEKLDSAETVDARIKRLGELSDAYYKQSEEMEEHREILRMVCYIHHSIS